VALPAFAAARRAAARLLLLNAGRSPLSIDMPRRRSAANPSQRRAAGE